MRHKLRALVSVLAVGLYVCEVAADESRSRWWPFGRGDAEEVLSEDIEADSKTSQTTHGGQQSSFTQPPIDGETDEHWMIESPFAKVSWPRFHMPEIPKPQMPQLWPEKSEVDAPRNAWMEHDPPSISPSPLQSLSDGARRVGDSTRAAWDKTVAALSPGDEDEHRGSRVARRETRLPWWKRMFGVEEQPEGPQTVTEWMAQERLDP